MTKDDRELIGRLRAKRDTGRRTLGGGNVWADGRPSEMWGCEPIFDYVNPDGPAAATRLEALQAQPVGEEGVVWAREVTARYFENDPLDKGRREIAQHTREGRYDDQDAVQIALHTLAARNCEAEATAYRNAARMIDCEDHASYRSTPVAQGDEVRDGVAQVDREAAADYPRILLASGADFRNSVSLSAFQYRNGSMDDTPIVKAFAKHRLATLTKGDRDAG